MISHRMILAADALARHLLALARLAHRAGACGYAVREHCLVAHGALFTALNDITLADDLARVLRVASHDLADLSHEVFLAWDGMPCADPACPCQPPPMPPAAVTAP